MTQPDTSRTIIHMDLDAFYCAVEVLLDPSLVDVAFIVGGRSERGVVASASYAARQFGIRSAMPTAEALRRCPHLKIVSNRRGVYSKYSQQVMEILHDVTPLVEQISIDEAFLDISDSVHGMGDAELLARELQQRIQDEIGLSASLGVASNKLVAKIASDLEKPHGLVVVPPGEETAFLAPLPVRELWGIGPVTAERLAQMGITTIGQLASSSEAMLKLEFGSHGPSMWRHAHGIDNRSVTTDREAKSISHEVTFTTDATDEEALARELLRQSESIGRRLRKAELHASTIKLKLRWSDFTTFTRQTTLPAPTNLDQDIYQTALGLLHKHWPKGKPVRLVGVGASNFGEPVIQLGLFDQVEIDDRQERLTKAVDDLRQRFGNDAVTRAALIEEENDD
jgi:DNA polymerase-4